MGGGRVAKKAGGSAGRLATTAPSAAAAAEVQRMGSHGWAATGSRIKCSYW
jgi:hypothetical protein